MKQHVQSVERALMILEALCEGERGLLELADSVELNKTTAHRLLATLIEAGYVRQNPENARYKLSTKMLRFGESVSSQLDIITLAKPHLRSLSELTGETVHLVSLEDTQAVYIDKIEPQSTIRMYSYIGKHVPLYCTAVGKVFLALSRRLSFKEWWESEKQTILPLTEHTITTIEGLQEVLNAVRQNGYAVDDEENEIGIYCIAAPIYDHTGDALYAISLSSPKFRIVDRNPSETLIQVQKTAEAITQEIGGIFPNKPK